MSRPSHRPAKARDTAPRGRAKVRKELFCPWCIGFGCALSVCPVFRLPSFIPRGPALLDTIHVTARVQEKLRVLRVFLAVLRIFSGCKKGIRKERGTSPGMIWRDAPAVTTEGDEVEISASVIARQRVTHRRKTRTLKNQRVRHPPPPYLTAKVCGGRRGALLLKLLDEIGASAPNRVG